MTWISNNLGQVAVIVAVITFFGVMIKAMTDWLTTSRSKYVDVIAAERIKWVGELRSDFRDLSVSFDELSHQCRQAPLDKEAANKAIEQAGRHQNLIHLKLNLEDELDRTVLALITRTGYVARSGDLEEYTLFKAIMTQYASYLLKDEWEKAKREASGPLRWVWLTFKNRRRRLARQELAKTEPTKSKLDLASTLLTPEQRSVLVAQAGGNRTGSSGASGENRS